MYAHHRATVDLLHQQYGDDPDVLALIIIGSTARGDARPESDVDFLLVVTEEEYEDHRRLQNTLLHFPDQGIPPCEGVFGERIDRSFLRKAAEHGPEPARFAFVDADIVFAHDPSIESVVRQIPVYPEAERLEKMRSFYSQLHMHFSYMELAHYSQNPYLLRETAVKLVLFGGRLILAHNRMLYPGRKWFLRALRSAPDQPVGIMQLAVDVLEQPGIPTANEFLQAIVHHADWPKPSEGWAARYTADSVQHWLTGWSPLEDR